MSKRRKTQRDVEPKKLSKRREEENDEFEMDEEEDDQMPESEEVHSTFSNPGWADVISKVLSKQPKLQPNQESCILSKATKDYELIETDRTHRTDKERQEWENLNRLKPNAGDPVGKERERKLAAIATRGVVQLFNTIAEQKEERRKKS